MSPMVRFGLSLFALHFLARGNVGNRNNKLPIDQRKQIGAATDRLIEHFRREDHAPACHKGKCYNGRKDLGPIWADRLLRHCRLFDDFETF